SVQPLRPPQQTLRKPCGPSTLVRHHCNPTGKANGAEIGNLICQASTNTPHPPSPISPPSSIPPASRNKGGALSSAASRCLLRASHHRSSTRFVLLEAKAATRHVRVGYIYIYI